VAVSLDVVFGAGAGAGAGVTVVELLVVVVVCAIATPAVIASAIAPARRNAFM
jgi:Tfp pilus assembly protein FimT